MDSFGAPGSEPSSHASGHLESPLAWFASGYRAVDALKAGKKAGNPRIGVSKPCAITSAFRDHRGVPARAGDDAAEGVGRGAAHDAREPDAHAQTERQPDGGGDPLESWRMNCRAGQLLNRRTGELVNEPRLPVHASTQFTSYSARSARSRSWVRGSPRSTGRRRNES